MATAKRKVCLSPYVHLTALTFDFGAVCKHSKQHFGSVLESIPMFHREHFLIQFAIQLRASNEPAASQREPAASQQISYEAFLYYRWLAAHKRWLAAGSLLARCWLATVDAYRTTHWLLMHY